MKRLGRRNLAKAFLPAVAFLLVLFPTPLYAHQSEAQSQAQSQQQQPLALSLAGAITDAGRHTYDSVGGQVVYASVTGMVLDPARTTISYQVHAEVDGLKVTGDASLKLSGVTAGGESVSVQGNMPLSHSKPVPAEEFPVGCTTQCNSEIVAFYTGVALLHVTVGSTQQQMPVSLSFESAFLNPFGKPIIIASLDNGTTLTVVTTYTSANIHWLDVAVAGTLTGTLGGTPVTGQFATMTAARDENLLAGTEAESGTMSFLGMSVPELDVSGVYNGTSTIPTTGTIDCSSLTGIPGTCTETGFFSEGTFSLGTGVSVTGSYQAPWYVPALGFTGTATATVTGGD